MGESLKQEIEKILKDSVNNDDYADYFGHEKASAALQKLFLEKKIEMLERFEPWLRPCMTLTDANMYLSALLEDAKSELKELQ